MRRALLLLALLAVAGCGDEPRAAAPAGSTREATLVDKDGDGFLEPGPALPLVERRDLGMARPGREIARFGQITDAHVRDEESPARVPFLDRVGPPFDPAFRPHEAESAQVLDAAVRALNTQAPQAVVMSGDIIDNAQANELDLAAAVLRGGRVNPDSGRPGYDGVQEAANPDPYYYRPDNDAPRHPGLADAAQRPFTAEGLKAPWLPVIGNHDALLQGEVPVTAELQRVAVGGEAVTQLDPDVDPPTDEADAPEAVELLLDGGLPGTTAAVPADPDRRVMKPAEAARGLRDASEGRAALHDGRLDYGFDLGPRVRGIVLDTLDRAGGAGGRLEPEQVEWLRAELARAGGRHVVVFSHNPLDGTENGDGALAAMADAGNVVAAVSGHRHRNAITPYEGRFWLVSTASLADFPQQSRMFCLREAAGGGVVLDTWMVDHDGRGLAGTARELAYLDAQGGRPLGYAGRREDRNARLYVP